MIDRGIWPVTDLRVPDHVGVERQGRNPVRQQDPGQQPRREDRVQRLPLPAPVPAGRAGWRSSSRSMSSSPVQSAGAAVAAWPSISSNSGYRNVSNSFRVMPRRGKSFIGDQSRRRAKKKTGSLLALYHDVDYFHNVYQWGEWRCPGDSTVSWRVQGRPSQRAVMQSVGSIPSEIGVEVERLNINMMKIIRQCSWARVLPVRWWPWTITTSDVLSIQTSPTLPAGHVRTLHTFKKESNRIAIKAERWCDWKTKKFYFIFFHLGASLIINLARWKN